MGQVTILGATEFKLLKAATAFRAERQGDGSGKEGT